LFKSSQIHQKNVKLDRALFVVFGFKNFDTTPTTDTLFVGTLLTKVMSRGVNFGAANSTLFKLDLQGIDSGRSGFF